MSKKQPKVQEPEVKDEEVVKTKGKPAYVYTYVGGGESSPHIINFMGRQKFVRGKATEVTDPEVLAKINGCPTFVEGEVDQEELFEYDEKAKQEADEQRKRDEAANAAYAKKHRTE